MAWIRPFPGIRGHGQRSHHVVKARFCYLPLPKWPILVPISVERAASPCAHRGPSPTISTTLQYKDNLLRKAGHGDPDTHPARTRVPCPLPVIPSGFQGAIHLQESTCTSWVLNLTPPAYKPNLAGTPSCARDRPAPLSMDADGNADA